ncbi:TetR/AcrR family transcriptional regulator [Pseudomonas aeruginosa]|uniref:TetR/AcrR family transcriptional regulator n=1 Tax=Pseudomonas aeruginosa TaxID=287 RepID=UPI001AEC36FA|nr:TetR/AcrR family transcriptional regulator [Pseudomonas aeruginosa]MBP2697983.1 TetR family transcriptional regulator [Pseudomonas aeruginosa]
MRQVQDNPVSAQTRSCASADRYADVLDKALELFSQRGFAQVSMRDLGKALGIHAGSLYHHIDSKDALLQELIEDLYSELLANAERVQRDMLAPASRLHALIDAHLDLHRNMAAHFQLAEQDFRYLGECYRDSILALRQRYEEHFLTPLGQLAPDTGSLALRSVARGIVSLLNQLPARFHPELCSTSVLRDMALGALQGAIAPIRLR